MRNFRRIFDDVFWVGGNDRRLTLFESGHPVPRGVSYNAYLVADEKTVLLDTVDRAVSDVFFENLSYLLDGKKLDFVIVTHMEPDHAATLSELVLRYPEVTVVLNSKTLAMVKNFFDFDIDSCAKIVAEGDHLCTGTHNFKFFMAPMVHWPEVMVAFDESDATLYSSDAFGTFGAVGGSIFADEVNFERDWLCEARRYYTNIVGKYGAQVVALLNKIANIEIKRVCPLHGFVWRKDIGWYVEKYRRWATFTPENNEVMIAYASVYGHTQNACEILASKLCERGISAVMYDVSVTHPSEVLSEAFRCSHLVFAATTYNAGIFHTMENLLHDISAHNLQNRYVSFIENGSWAATSGGLMAEIFAKLKNITFIGEKVSVKSSVKDAQLIEIDRLAQSIAETFPKKAETVAERRIDNASMFKLSYGLFVLTANGKNGANGCIINTVTQITDNPKRVSIAVNKANLTHDLVRDSSAFCVSVLSQNADFEVFKHFGFQSGRNTDKFAGLNCPTDGLGHFYIGDGSANAYISAKVIDAYDYQTHTVFIAEVVEAATLSGVPSATYQYYFDHIKPKPQPVSEKKKGYVCKICGYVHEGDLPSDFVCPLCKHGAEDFEPLG